MSPLVSRPRWSRTPCAPLDGLGRLWSRSVVVDELAAPRRRGRRTRRAGRRVLSIFRARYCACEGSSRLLDGSTVSCLGEPAPDLLVAKTPRLCPEVVAACVGHDETQPAHSLRCTATLCHGSSVPRVAGSYTFTQATVPPGRITPRSADFLEFWMRTGPKIAPSVAPGA